jgi:hypothetical protein
MGQIGSLKRVWITLNGIKRLCPTDVPVSVALGQMGQRRFEDALFCADGQCQLCEVTIDGKTALACQTKVREGQNIELTSPIKLEGAAGKDLLCPCSKVENNTYQGLRQEGVSRELAMEHLRVGQGRCHGQWCLASKAIAAEDNDTPRPVFHGFEGTPWRDVLLSDLLSNFSEPSEISED